MRIAQNKRPTQAVVLVVGMAIVDYQIAALDIALFSETLSENSD
jgi:hypothetical protein